MKKPQKKLTPDEIKAIKEVKADIINTKKVVKK